MAIKCLYEEFEQAMPNYKNPTLKRFDLCVGDKVRKVTRKHHGSENVEVCIENYIVKAIFPHVFLCENKWQEKTTFQKVEYQIGVVYKVEDEQNAY